MVVFYMYYSIDLGKVYVLYINVIIKKKVYVYLWKILYDIICEIIMKVNLLYFI